MTKGYQYTNLEVKEKSGYSNGYTHLMVVEMDINGVRYEVVVRKYPMGWFLSRAEKLGASRASNFKREKQNEIVDYILNMTGVVYDNRKIEEAEKLKEEAREAELHAKYWEVREAKEGELIRLIGRNCSQMFEVVGSNWDSSWTQYRGVDGNVYAEKVGNYEVQKVGGLNV